MAEPAPRQRLFTPAFIALGLADLCYFTAVGVSIFTLPLHVTGPAGADEAGAGLAFGVFAVSALVLRPIIGRLTDRHGRLPFLLAGALLAAASLALIAHVEDFVVIILLRLLAGVAEAAFFVAGFAALVDLAPPQRLGEALSYNSLGLYLGIALGPPLAELLVTSGGYPLAWYGAAGLALLAAALALIVRETRPAGTAGAPPGRLIHRPALPICVAFVASVAAMGGFLAFASLYAERTGLASASLPLFIYGGVVVVCRIAFARVPDRVPSLPLGAASLAAIGTGLVVVAALPSLPGLVVGVAVMGVGVAFSTPAFLSAIFATASPAQRGAASGTATAAIDLGLGIGPIALGLVAGSFGIGWAFAAAAAVAFAGGLWTLRLRVAADRADAID